LINKAVGKDIENKQAQINTVPLFNNQIRSKVKLIKNSRKLSQSQK